MPVYIRVTWGSGSMDINLDKFLPATLSDTRKLIRLIKHDWQWDWEKTHGVIMYLENRIEDEKDAAAKTQIEANMAWFEANGAKALLPANLPRKSPRYREYVRWKDNAKECDARVRQHKRNVEGLKKTLEMFEELRCSG